MYPGKIAVPPGGGGIGPLRNSVYTPAKLPCRRVVEGNKNNNIIFSIFLNETLHPTLLN
jgi:hypothetical protein